MRCQLGWDNKVAQKAKDRRDWAAAVSVSKSGRGLPAASGVCCVCHSLTMEDAHPGLDQQLVDQRQLGTSVVRKGNGDRTFMDAIGILLAPPYMEAKHVPKRKVCGDEITLHTPIDRQR